MRAIHFLICVFAFPLVSCAQASTPIPEAQVVSVYATLAVQPWLGDVYDCAPAGTIIMREFEQVAVDISLRLGEPDILLDIAYQIDTEEILIVTHRQSPIQNLSVEGVRELFAGQGDPSVQVWVYASGEDIQKVFDQAVMAGRSVTSMARLAVSPQHMSDTLNNEPNAIGILPHHWKTGDSRFVFTIPDVPVLAVVREEPQGAIREIITCLQK